MQQGGPGLLRRLRRSGLLLCGGALHALTGDVLEYSALGGACGHGLDVLSVAEQEYFVAESRQLVDLRRGQHHGEALPRDAVDELVYLLLGTYVDAAGGVVQYQQLGVGSQPFGQQHLLLVAAGQLNNGVFRGSADHV